MLSTVKKIIASPNIKKVSFKISIYVQKLIVMANKSEQGRRAYFLSMGLGVIYFLAFLSLSLELKGLFGEDGIRPISMFLSMLENRDISFLNVPSIFWINQSDMFLQFMCLMGLVSSLLLIFGIFSGLMALLSWFLYLSFVNVGFPFLSFQWDVLLLESGFLLLFLAPFKVFWKVSDELPYSKLAIIAFRLLLFKLMFTSGLVKLFSDDNSWIGLTALNYHYLTQPLPHFLSWFFHLLPEWVDKIGVLLMFFVELIVPFGLFLSNKIRHYSACLIVAFMCLIMLSGNYTYFNVLVIVLCLSCFSFKSITLNQSKKIFTKHMASIAIIFLMTMSVLFEFNRFVIKSDDSIVINKAIRSFKLVNQYGLFTIMTKQRNEIEILASMDGENWKPYEFKSKMNHKSDMPKWVWPMQPRLDWQFWFVALRPVDKSPWVFRLVEKLFKKEQSVEALFKTIPFKKPPNYIVLMKRNVEFSSMNKLIKQGHWWTVGKQAPFSPVFSNPN